MIDLHCHLLYGVDDGPSNLEQSLEMLEIAADDGIRAIVATPHADLRYRFNRARCIGIVEELRTQSTSGVDIKLGCELHLTPENISSAVADPAAWTIASAGYVLLELPDSVSLPMITPAVDTLVSSGLHVLIAHPERNLFLQKNPGAVEHIVQSGCYLQITAQAILGSFGATAERAAGQMLAAKLAHVVSTDAHGPDRRRPILSAAYSRVAREYGRPAADLLFNENPSRVVRGEPLSRIAGKRRSSILDMILGDSARNKHAHSNLS